MEDDDRLWLFFFTRIGPLEMTLDSVKVEGHRIDVSYTFPKRNFGQRASVPHFALIPIGKLEAGEYDVMIPKNEIVCDSFKFSVGETP